MGKYMRKPKITGDVAVMEVLSQSSVGVRTRAKTHALQRLQSTSPEPSYLQLRNRRLEKVIPSLNESKKQQSARKDGSGRNPNPSGGESPRSRLSPRPVGSGSVGSVSINCSKSEQGVNCEFAKRASKEGETEDYNDLGFEASFGEHNLEFEGRERTATEVYVFFSQICHLSVDSVLFVSVWFSGKIGKGKEIVQEGGVL
ncbi:hypothetical protein Acr_28g0008500 [Actinidia rufa]|uniref:Uncharacterized protein n=1 Tax=Actinidia rufa TaxID=165716 RepID=A0A7J0HAZ8_9ERIC|nr:hypothetical protein Acr_28g0008500 [Actinidia rufa]